MFKDKGFNKAIIFSAAWHLFWISVIGVAIMPSVQSSSAYQEVEFLGPILEKTAFDFMVESATPQAETLYARSVLMLGAVYLKPRGPERKVLKKTASAVTKITCIVIPRKPLKKLSVKEASPARM